MSKELMDSIIDAVDTAAEINEDGVKVIIDVHTGKIVIDIPSETK